MFSAIGVMAFSVSSVGNTILIDEKINSIVFEEIEMQEGENNERCFERGIITFHQAITAGYTENEATLYMNIAEAICLGWSLSDVRL
jgi:hypothetical protein